MTTVYDTLDDPLSVTDPDHVTTTDTYDGAGNLLTASTPLLNSAGNAVLNGATPVVDKTSYSHNDGHLEDVTSMTDADGNTWTYSYDPSRGYLLSATAPATSDNKEHPGVAQSNETLYGYDAVKGWPTASLSPRGQQATGASPSLALSCTPPAVGCTTYSHVDSTRPSGFDLFGHATVTTNADGGTTKAHFDADQNQEATTDGNGNTTITTFDAAGEPTVVTQADATTTRTDYNLDGTATDTVDANGAQTTYGYDNQGRVISGTTPPSVTNPTGDTTSYGYDPAGNQVTKADPGGELPHVADHLPAQPVDIGEMHRLRLRRRQRGDIDHLLRWGHPEHHLGRLQRRRGTQRPNRELSGGGHENLHVGVRLAAQVDLGHRQQRGDHHRRLHRHVASPRPGTAVRADQYRLPGGGGRDLDARLRRPGPDELRDRLEGEHHHLHL